MHNALLIPADRSLPVRVITLDSGRDQIATYVGSDARYLIFDRDCTMHASRAAGGEYNDRATDYVRHHSQAVLEGRILADERAHVLSGDVVITGGSVRRSYYLSPLPDRVLAHFVGDASERHLTHPEIVSLLGELAAAS